MSRTFAHTPLRIVIERNIPNYLIDNYAPDFRTPEGIRVPLFVARRPLTRAQSKREWLTEVGEELA